MEESTLSAKSSPSPTRQSSVDTTVTTPDQSPGADDDIWETSSDYHPSEPYIENHGNGSGLGPSEHHHPRGEMLSDLPALRRQHMTDGYREGLAIGKAKVMQSGFDAGYPVGVELGLRVGRVLGVLEGVLAAMTSSKGKGKGAGGGGRAATRVEGLSAPVTVQSVEVSVSQNANTDANCIASSDVTFVQNLYDKAQEELQVSRLMGLIDDEVIAGIPSAVTNVDCEVVTASGTQKPQVPPAIEAAVRKWECLIEEALHGGRHIGTAAS
jgi:hypothetical protein